MKNYIIIALVATLTGCASSDKVKLVELDKNTNAIPEWVASEPPPNEKEITVVATDTSRDMQFAIDKAMMQARVELANRVNVKVESVVKESLVEDGVGKMKDIDREVERTSRQVTNQTLSLYTRNKLYVSREGEGYRAYVMLKMNIDQARRLAESKKDRSDKFKELDEAIK